MAIPTEVDRSAPALSEHQIDINAPRELVWRLHTDIAAWPTWQTDITDAALEQPLEPGVSFRWSTSGMTITSTVYAIDEGSRILWGGTVSSITGIHDWIFTNTANGVRVATTEPFSGGPVDPDSDAMQGLLDQSLISWLSKLKVAAELKHS